MKNLGIYVLTLLTLILTHNAWAAVNCTSSPAGTAIFERTYVGEGKAKLASVAENYAIEMALRNSKMGQADCSKIRSANWKTKTAEVFWCEHASPVTCRARVSAECQCGLYPSGSEARIRYKKILSALKFYYQVSKDMIRENCRGELGSYAQALSRMHNELNRLCLNPQYVHKVNQVTKIARDLVIVSKGMSDRYSSGPVVRLHCDSLLSYDKSSFTSSESNIFQAASELDYLDRPR